MNNKKAQSSSPLIYPADILGMPDNKGNEADTAYIDQHMSSGPYALYLSLPDGSARVFKECEKPVVIDCSVFQMKADFRVALIVMQAESLQARVVVPICDAKSRAWLEQCVMQSSLICFLSAQGTSRYRRFDSDVSFSNADAVLADIRRTEGASGQEVLLAIGSSLPDIAEPGAVPSYISGTAVGEVNVCVVRDFFNTTECLQAVEELQQRKPNKIIIGN